MRRGPFRLRAIPWVVTPLLAVLVATLAARRAGAGETGASSSSWVRTAAAVDAALEARLAEEGVAPAPGADDAEWLRRIYLDLTGTVPTGEEAEAFAADPSPDKRLVKGEELLGSDAYADAWGAWWFKTLTGLTTTARRGGDGARLLVGTNGETFRDWLRDQMAANRPYDAFAYDLLTATGRTDENGATGFYARWEGKPNDLAGATARVFLGVRIQCAQCHDHVYEPTWKQKDFQGMAAYWLTTFPRRIELPEAARAEARTRFVASVEEVDVRRFGGRAGARAERRGRELPPEIQERLDLASVTPKTWMGPATADVAGIPRRLLLARWITAKDNPYFARALVNRYWGHFFGRGLVHPVDEFGSFNTPSHPEVLDLLAADFVASGYDLKRLVRVLVSTRAYQRTSRGVPSEKAAAPERPELFARAAVRPLTTEQLYFSLARAGGLEDRMDRLARRNGRQGLQAAFAAFSTVFDDDEMTEHVDFQGSIPQGLFLMNGQVLEAAVDEGERGTSTRGRRGARAGIAPQNTVQRVLQTVSADPERVRRLWLAAYGREPSPAERRAALAFLGRGEGDAAWSDLFWALLNSAEFMTNH